MEGEFVSQKTILCHNSGEIMPYKTNLCSGKLFDDSIVVFRFVLRLFFTLFYGCLLFHFDLTILISRDRRIRFFTAISPFNIWFILILFHLVTLLLRVCYYGVLRLFLDLLIFSGSNIEGH